MIDPAIMKDVARELLGEPNPQLSTEKELRYGNHGSVSVDLEKGTFYDHEAGEGGGVLELIRRQAGLVNGAAFEWLQARGLASEEPGRRPTFEERIETVYRYEDAAGVHLYDVVRLRNPKDFRQRAPGGSWSTKGIRRVLYRLPELAAADKGALVFIVEGEKDVDRLRAAGLLATSSPEGAGKWRDDFGDSLKQCRVAIIPDNDEYGEKHAEAVLASLQRRGIVSAILRLEGLPHKGDVSDWLAAGGTTEKLVEAARDLLKPACDLTPTPFRWVDPTAIAPRPWLYGRHLIRKQVSVTVAAGGVGKSSLAIAEAIAMTSGRNLLGDWVAGRLRVWLFNLEDPRDELQRRIAAAMIHHRVTPDEIGDRLFVDTGRERSLCTAVQLRDGVRILKPQVEALEEAIRSRKIDVLGVDPFVSSHQVSENDNGAIDLVAKEWARIADRCNCAIDLTHHVRKTNGGEASSEDGRGASALLGAARSGRVLNRMTEKQREEAGVQNDPATYFAVNRDKANLAPEGKRVWRRMASVDLGQGDQVGVAEVWEWPDAFAGMTATDLLRVQQAIDGKELRYSDQAKDWVGNVVAELFELAVDADLERKRIKLLIEGWLKSGALVKRMKEGPQRKQVPIVEVGEWATE